MPYNFLTSCLFFLLCYRSATAQSFSPGNTYYGKDNYIEYFAGNAPLILSVPHGGYLEPVGMPDRDCIDCAYVRDAYTQELARLIQSKFIERTGCYPHLVYNLIHRKKLDLNRDLLAATDTNATLDQYWYDYHRFIDSAKSSIQRNYAKGLFIDLHGHGHTKQRIELGYLVSKTTLGLPDSLINLPKYTNFTSIRSLALSNLKGINHVALLKGPWSMGSLLENKGFPSVPSSSDPYPLAADEYFNGGYNTVRHGSNSSGAIDAIQFELYSSIRFDSTERRKFADSLITILIDYLGLHYFVGYNSKACSTTQLTNTTTQDKIAPVYPNPCSDQLFVRNPNPYTHYSLLNTVGQYLEHKKVYVPHQPISVAHLPSGWLFLLLYNAHNNTTLVFRIFKE